MPQHDSGMSWPTELFDVEPLDGQAISCQWTWLNQDGTVQTGFANSLGVDRYTQIIELNSKSDHKLSKFSFMFLVLPLFFHLFLATLFKYKTNQLSLFATLILVLLMIII